MVTDYPAMPLEFTVPQQLDKAVPIVNTLKELSTSSLASLMKINPKLAQLNYERYQQWAIPFNKKNASPAVFSYHGEVYNGLNIQSFSKSDLRYTQEHLRILSALYGVLRPLDLIQAYRLEMAARLKPGQSKNLYDYWSQSITDTLNQTLLQRKKPILINLASNEYFKCINKKSIKGTILTPVFKEIKHDKPVIVTMYAKKARGLMTRYILKNRIKTIKGLKLFDEEGYFYNPQLSSEHDLVFTR